MLYLLACFTGKEILVDTGSQEDNQLTLPLSGCGIDPYVLLDKEGMGEIVSIDHRPELSLSKEAIASLLSNFELPLPEPQYDVETYFIEYRSQDRGKEINATGIISIPLRDDEDVPIVLWEHPTMGFADDCAPTATGVVGAAYPVLVASLGLAVIAPD